MRTVILATALLTSAAAGAAPPEPPPDAPAPPRAGTRSGDAVPGREDAHAGLRRVAALLLDGDAEGAIELARRLGERGVIAPAATGDSSARAARAFSLLTGVWPDPEAALEALGERPDQGDVAWPVARALALERAGESEEAAAAFEELARTLRAGAGLDVRRVRFARRVESFGVYEDDPRESFRPGESVLVYAELRGFVCEPVDRPAGPDPAEGAKAEGPGEPRGPGRGPGPLDEAPDATWRVRLEVRVSLATFPAGLRRAEAPSAAQAGEAAASWGPEPVEHVTRAKVRDLHLTRLVDLPADLAPGEYELRLDVRDLGRGGQAGVGLRRLVVARR